MLIALIPEEDLDEANQYFSSDVVDKSLPIGFVAITENSVGKAEVLEIRKWAISCSALDQHPYEKIENILLNEKKSGRALLLSYYSEIEHMELQDSAAYIE